MKPVIRKVTDNLWSCDSGTPPVGYGATPLLAHRDWENACDRSIPRCTERQSEWLEALPRVSYLACELKRVMFYERRKKEFSEYFSDATPRQYEHAMCVIGARAGI